MTLEDRLHHWISGARMAQADAAAAQNGPAYVAAAQREQRGMDLIGKVWDRADKRKKAAAIVQPAIGMGATLCYPQDLIPYIITAVGKNQIAVMRLKTAGAVPSGYCNGFPVYDGAISANIENVEEGTGRQTAYLRKDGRYYLGGIRLSLGQARYRRNYAD